MVCAPSWGHVAVWRIKLAAVVYRLPPPSPSAPLSPQVSISALRHYPPTTPYKSLSPCQTHAHTHTVLNSCNIHQQPNHDTVYSDQPLLPRVCWLSSMQISHVLIVVIYLFISYGREKKNSREEFPPELIRWLSEKERDSAVLWAAIQCLCVWLSIYEWKVYYKPEVMRSGEQRARSILAFL